MSEFSFFMLRRINVFPFLFAFILSQRGSHATHGKCTIVKRARGCDVFTRLWLRGKFTTIFNFLLRGEENLLNKF